MDIPGLSPSQAPARADLRLGASSAAPAAANTQPLRTDVPNPVPEVSRSAEAASLRKTQEGEAIIASSPSPQPSAESLFADVFPEPLPADLSAAERSEVYAQIFGNVEGPLPNERANAAERLFLTTANLFRPDA
ncbi:hypothetical protein [Parvularcula marina]|uniref:hypothetical protein n=1 Tax=Parvularcula marina TaxID=2292771 RepID=UPI0035131A7C